MKYVVEQPRFRCDLCGVEINETISTYPGQKNIVSLGDSDFCNECSAIILEELFEAGFIKTDTITQAIRRIKNRGKVPQRNIMYV